VARRACTSVDACRHLKHAGTYTCLNNRNTSYTAMPARTIPAPVSLCCPYSACVSVSMPLPLYLRACSQYTCFRAPAISAYVSLCY
jgi:capsular polysaccharide biosynthesis protein